MSEAHTRVARVTIMRRSVRALRWSLAIRRWAALALVIAGGIVPVWRFLPHAHGVATARTHVAPLGSRVPRLDLPSLMHDLALP